MWKALKSIFQRSEVDDDPVYDELKALVEDLLAQDHSDRSKRAAQDGQIIDVLERLNKEIETLRAQASGSPDGTIPTQTWLNGVGYADLCRKLTLHFRQADWLLREENSSALWTRATLTVNSHHRHLVGPAMLANADCQERLGNPDRAAQMYRAVVSDFELLLGEERADVPLDEDERTAIESLRTALRRLLAIGTGHKDRERLKSLLASSEAALK